MAETSALFLLNNLVEWQGSRYSSDGQDFQEENVLEQNESSSIHTRGHSRSPLGAGEASAAQKVSLSLHRQLTRSKSRFHSAAAPDATSSPRTSSPSPVPHGLALHASPSRAQRPWLETLGDGQSQVPTTIADEAALFEFLLRTAPAPTASPEPPARLPSGSIHHHHSPGLTAPAWQDTCHNRRPAVPTSQADEAGLQGFLQQTAPTAVAAGAAAGLVLPGQLWSESLVGGRSPQQNAGRSRSLPRAPTRSRRGADGSVRGGDASVRGADGSVRPANAAVRTADSGSCAVDGSVRKRGVGVGSGEGVDLGAPDAPGFGRRMALSYAGHSAGAADGVEILGSHDVDVGPNAIADAGDDSVRGPLRPPPPPRPPPGPVLSRVELLWGEEHFLRDSAGAARRSFVEALQEPGAGHAAGPAGPFTATAAAAAGEDEEELAPVPLRASLRRRASRRGVDGRNAGAADADADAPAAAAAAAAASDADAAASQFYRTGAMPRGSWSNQWRLGSLWRTPAAPGGATSGGSWARFAAAVGVGGSGSMGRGGGSRGREWVCMGVDGRMGRWERWRLTLLADPWDIADKYLPLFLPSTLRTSWDVLLLVLLLYTAVIVPLEAGFRSAVLPGIEASHIGVLTVFWLDIIVQFRTAFVSPSGELVRDSRAIAAQYARTWLALDLVSSVPWGEVLKLVLDKHGSSAGVLASLARLPRLLRLLRLVQLLDRFRYASLLRMARLLGLLMLLSHWAACAWHGLSEWISAWPWLFSEQVNPDDSLMHQYSVALYYSYVLVVGSDNPQPPPQNNLERTFMIAVLVSGSLLSALVISHMAMVVANLNSLSSRYTGKAALAADALRYVGAPEEQRARVADYYDFLAQNEHPGPDADSFLCELPRGLVEELKWALYSGAVAGLGLFAGCDEPFMAALQARLTLAAFTPGEVIYQAQDMGRDMYIVRRGCVLLRSPSGELADLLTAGQAFGSLALLPDLAARRRGETAVAGQPTDVVVLSARDLAAVCRDHPDSGAMVQERLLQQLETHLAGGIPYMWYGGDELLPLSYSFDETGYDMESWFQSGGQALVKSASGGSLPPTPSAVPPPPPAALPSPTFLTDTGSQLDSAGREGIRGSQGKDLKALHGSGNSDGLDMAAAEVAEPGSRTSSASAAGSSSSASSWASFLEAAGIRPATVPPRIPPRVPPSTAAAAAAGQRRRGQEQLVLVDPAPTTAPDIEQLVSVTSGPITAPTADIVQELPLALMSTDTTGAAEGFVSGGGGSRAASLRDRGDGNGGGALLGSKPAGNDLLAAVSDADPLMSTAGSVLAAFAEISAPSARSATRPVSPWVPPRPPAAAAPPSPSQPLPQQRPMPADGEGRGGGAGDMAEVQPHSPATLRPSPLPPPPAAPLPPPAAPPPPMPEPDPASPTVRPLFHLLSTSSSRLQRGISSSLRPFRAHSGLEAADHDRSNRSLPGAALAAPPPSPSVRASPNDPRVGGSPSATAPGSVPRSRASSASEPPSRHASSVVAAAAEPAFALPGQALGRTTSRLAAMTSAASATRSGSGTPAPSVGSASALTGPPVQLILPPPAADTFSASPLPPQPSGGSGGGGVGGGGGGGGGRAEPPARLSSIRALWRLASLVGFTNLGGPGSGGGGADGPERSSVSGGDGNQVRPLHPTGGSTPPPTTSGGILEAGMAAGRGPGASPGSGEPQWVRGGGGGAGVRVIRRYLSTAAAFRAGIGGGSPARPRRMSEVMGIAGPASGLAASPARVLRRGNTATASRRADAMASAPAWLIARASRDNWTSRRAPPPPQTSSETRAVEDPVATALVTLTRALGLGTGPSAPDGGAAKTHGSPAGSGPMGQQFDTLSSYSQLHFPSRQSRNAPPPPELSAAHVTALLRMADAVVRRFGVERVPAVQEAVTARVLRLETRMAEVLQPAVARLQRIEQTVVQLDESAAMAKRRLAAIEREAAEAAGDGVLAPNLLGLLDTESQLDLALDSIQSQLHTATGATAAAACAVGSGGRQAWAAMLSMALTSQTPAAPTATAEAGGAGAGSRPVSACRAPPHAHLSRGASPQHRSNSQVLSRARSGASQCSRRGSVLSDVSDGTAAVAAAADGGSMPARAGSSVLLNAEAEHKASGSGASAVRGPAGGAAAAAVGIRRQSQDAAKWQAVFRRRSDRTLQQGGAASGTSSLHGGAAAAAMAGFAVPRHGSTDRLGATRDGPEDGAGATHGSADQRVSAGGGIVAAGLLPVLTASVDGKPIPDAALLATAMSSVVSTSTVQPLQHPFGSTALRPSTSAGMSLTHSAAAASAAAHRLPGLSPWPGAGRAAMLDDSVVRDGGGAAGGRAPQPTLLPSERPGARRSKAPAPRGGAEHSTGVETSWASLSAGGQYRRPPIRHASTSALAVWSSGPSLTAAAAAAAAAGATAQLTGAAAVVAGLRQPSRTAASRAAAAAAAAAAVAGSEASGGGRS